MTDVYADTEYSVTMLAVLAEHRGFVIRKMPLRYGTGGLKMSKYRAICYYSGYSEGHGDTEEEAIADAEYHIPLDADADSFETFCEECDEEIEQED